ncbi:MAG: LacI family DNA-binding transcriptional regulator [Devosia sp.]|nr:LacI family DNA-binding transcriptional regulator [Devosia sp.]
MHLDCGLRSLLLAKRCPSSDKDWRASQREIAERAGTSLKTVSRVINRDPLVNARNASGSRQSSARLATNQARRRA